MRKIPSGVYITYFINQYFDISIKITIQQGQKISIIKDTGKKKAKQFYVQIYSIKQHTVFKLRCDMHAIQVVKRF